MKLKTEVIIVLVVILLVGTTFSAMIFAYSQDKKELLRAKRQKTLEDTPFDTVVLTTLVALEQNYQVKKRLLPLVHEDDYYAVVLNTAKRIILKKEIANRISPSAPAVPDTTKAK